MGRDAVIFSVLLMAVGFEGGVWVGVGGSR